MVRAKQAKPLTALRRDRHSQPGSSVKSYLFVHAANADSKLKWELKKQENVMGLGEYKSEQNKSSRKTIRQRVANEISEQ